MATTATARTPAQVFALVSGVLYLIIGFVGFAVTGFDDFAKETGEELVIFGLNPLHNIVHIALGAVWLVVSGSHERSKMVNLVFGATLLLVSVLGLVGALEFLSIADAAEPDNYLHLVWGSAGIYFGTAGAVARGPMP